MAGVLIDLSRATTTDQTVLVAHGGMRGSFIYNDEVSNIYSMTRDMQFPRAHQLDILIV